MTAYITPVNRAATTGTPIKLLQQLPHHPGICDRLALVVVVESHEDAIRPLGQAMNTRDPFFQFGFLIKIVVALVGLLVLPPVPNVAPMESNIAEVGSQRRGTTYKPPATRARPPPRRPCSDFSRTPTLPRTPNRRAGTRQPAADHPAVPPAGRDTCGSPGST